MDIKTTKNEIQLILDKQEFMGILEAFDSATTLSDAQIELMNELENFMMQQITGLSNN